jgi:hypothetical protein
MQIYVPQILIPKFVEIDDPFETRMGVWGEFHIIKKTHGRVSQELKFRNVITDVGLKYLASIGGGIGLGSVLRYCHLGTGTAVPTSADTALQVFGSSMVCSSTGKALGATNDRYTRFQWDFNQSAVIGNWTEVGIGWQNNGNVFCRMLFKDSNGNPVPINKTSEDTLTIIYNLHIVRSSDVPSVNELAIDGVGNVTIQSLITDNGLWALTNDSLLNNVSSYGNTARLGTGTSLSTTKTGCQTKIDIAPTLYSTLSYVTDSFYREFLFEWPASLLGNIAEACMPFCGSSTNTTHIAMVFNPVIPKTDNTKKLRLRERITYARAS